MLRDFPPSRIARLPIEVLTGPFQSFARMEAAGGILLLASAATALFWANSAWAESYHAFWNLKVSVGFGRFGLAETLHEWVNDGLMPIFFFLVGLEIKREVLVGELSSLRQAAFPLISAVGGAAVPALLYLAIARGEEARRGWAIPMATDIAFVIGALALLGSRVPLSLKVFATALAIADDLIAVLVIAILFTAQIHLASLALSLAGLALCFVANLLGVRKPAVYAILGIFVWYCMLLSGIHATVAGVLLALTIPTKTYVDRDSFLRRSRWLIDRYEASPENSPHAYSAIHMMASQLELVEPPLERMEHFIHPWVTFTILPLFALANLGIPIVGSVGFSIRHPVGLGVIVGLFAGKPLGIWLFARMSAGCRLASAPSDMTWSALFGTAWLCGIGFTMSLFIATLAFGDGTLLTISKIGVLVGSLASAACASVFLVWQGHAAAQSSSERSAA